MLFGGEGPHFADVSISSALKTAEVSRHVRRVLEATCPLFGRLIIKINRDMCLKKVKKNMQDIYWKIR